MLNFTGGRSILCSRGGEAGGIFLMLLSTALWSTIVIVCLPFLWKWDFSEQIPPILFLLNSVDYSLSAIQT